MQWLVQNAAAALHAVMANCLRPAPMMYCSCFSVNETKPATQVFPETRAIVTSDGDVLWVVPDVRLLAGSVDCPLLCLDRRCGLSLRWPRARAASTWRSSCSTSNAARSSSVRGPTTGCRWTSSTWALLAISASTPPAANGTWSACLQIGQSPLSRANTTYALTACLWQAGVMHAGVATWRCGSVVRTSVSGWRTFPDLCLIYDWQVITLWVNRW